MKKDRNAKKASKKIETINPKTSKSDKTEKPKDDKSTPDSKTFTVEGAEVVKRFNAKLALIERAVLIPGTELKVRVRLYHAVVDGKVFETTNRKEANEWIKTNAPARGKKSDKSRSVIVKMVRAQEALNKAFKRMQNVDSAKGVNERTKKIAQESMNEIHKIYTRINAEVELLNTLLAGQSTTSK